jgi:adenylate cyclase
MKSFLYTICFSLLFHASVFSDNQGIKDSLNRIISNTNEDTAIVLSYIELTFQTSSLDTALFFAEKALEISKESEYSFGEMYACFRLARLYEFKGNYDKALHYYLRKEKIAIETEKIEENKGIYADIGAMYYMKGDWEKSVLYYQKGLRLSESVQDSNSISMFLNNIGIVYNSWKRPEKALEYYFKAIALDQLLGKERNMAVIYNNIGLLYLDTDELDSAEKYIDKSLFIKKKYDDTRGIAISLANLGNISFLKKEYNEALQYQEEALEKYKAPEATEDIALTMNNIAAIYAQFGQYTKALKLSHEALDMVKSVDYPDLHLSIYETLSETYALKKDFQNALKYNKLHHAVKDSIFTLEKNQQLEEIETKYQTEKKEQQIKLQKTELAKKDAEVKKQKAQRNIFIISFILILLFAIYVIISLRRLGKEKAKSERLLLNTLPLKVVNDLKQNGTTKPESFTDVTVYFSDVVGFTNMSTQLEPKKLIDELNDIFTAFDDIMERNHCERIKTIGDAYLAVCGMPDKNDNHATHMLRASLEIKDYLEKRNQGQEIQWRIRIGLHSGKVVGGIVGVRKYIYDVFGDTINTASRMESNSEPMRINISDVTYQLVKDGFSDRKLSFSKRDPIEVKGKGVMDMYFVNIG